jgi:hypothetical protein
MHERLDGRRVRSILASNRIDSNICSPDLCRDAADCQRCGLVFTLLVRRHHCRYCGQLFCRFCTTKKRLVPKYGYATAAVRVCDACESRLATAENLLSAINASDLNLSNRIIRRNKSFVELVDVFSPLTIAAKCGNLEIVMSCLERNADVNMSVEVADMVLAQCQRCRKTTLFNTTVCNGKFGCPSCATHMGLDKFFSMPDLRGLTPLHAALLTEPSKFEVKIAEALIVARANVNAHAGPLLATGRREGLTPLMMASHKGHTLAVHMLLQAMADPCGMAGAAHGDTALHLATSNGHSDIVALLVSARASAEVRNSKGFTALMIAQLNSFSNIVQILDPLEGKRRQGAIDDSIA